MKQANKIFQVPGDILKPSSKSSALQKEVNVNRALTLESSGHFLSTNGQFFYLCGLFLARCLAMRAKLDPTYVRREEFNTYISSSTPE